MPNLHQFIAVGFKTGLMPTMLALSVLLISCSQSHEAVTISDSTTGIFNGETISKTEPMANSIVEIKMPNGASCTGTLIAPKIILTAAHCVMDEGVVVDEEVTSGIVVALSSVKIPCQIALVESIAFHPDSFEIKNGASRNIDLAILRLSGDLCLGVPAKLNTKPALLGDTAIAAGFGQGTKSNFQADRIEVRFGEYSAETILADFDAEQAAELKEPMEQWFQVMEPWLELASPVGSKQSTCFGDSGGPIYTETNNEAILHGVLSKNFNTPKGDPLVCDLAYHMGIVPVDRFLDWINAEMAK